MPTRGTTASSDYAGLVAHFNPRAHEGHDSVKVTCTLIFNISIHVPTRGTTLPASGMFQWMNFNPRAHEGHDPHTRLHDSSSLHFNPRAHEGHDARVMREFGTLAISIHVPTRGTTIPAGVSLPERDFSPRAHEGHARAGNTWSLPCRNFNPRAHEGHDLRSAYPMQPRVFQSTCPRGARLARSASAVCPVNFNPRAHEGHDLRCRPSTMCL